MAERGYFFDSTQNDQHVYQAADLARFFAPIIGNGFSNTTQYADLEVTAKTNMDIQVGAGLAYHNGYMYENDSALTLTHDIADPNNDRIDRVVVRFDNDPAVKEYYSYIKKGSPGGGAPSLESNNYVAELAIAQVIVRAGQSYVEQADITDERPGNYIDLHNLKRGVQVNEKGVVTMPNQSYVDVFTRDITDSYLKFRESDDDVLDVPLESVESDNQNELSGSTFVPKADGVYNVWIQLRTQEIDLRELNIDKADVQIHANINGSRPGLPLFAAVFNGPQDNIWTGSQIINLNAGDEFKFQAWLQHFNDTPNIPIRDVRCRIAKIS